MENKKQKHLWEEDDDDQPLRRPNSASAASDTIFPIEDSIGSLSVADSASTSEVPGQIKFNVYAEEWYPHNYLKCPAQDRLRKIKQDEHQHQNSSESNGICFNETTDHTEIFEKLQDFINVLIEDPGQFDILLNQCIESLESYHEEANVLHGIAKLIFSEAVAEPNFRYSAARLCRVLEHEFPLFKSSLHLYAENLINDIPPDSERDLSLTLAELFAQSDCDNLYGNFVIKGIESMVSNGGLDNIKCVCQVLKLTGSSLDIHHKTKLDSIFNELEHVRPNLPSLTNLINCVISLRASHWGQVDLNSYSAPTGDNMYFYNHPDGPIFYGPDGKELSEEEKQFLSDNYIEFFGEDLLDSDPDELFDPDNEMDEEVHAAFREFDKANRK